MASDEVNVALVALVVSCIAFIATFMQCLQQYYASAKGFSQCNEKVMGQWAKSRTRRINWRELRFEVEFDTPVIFVCPPGNTMGPVPDASILMLDGSTESYEKAKVDKKTSPRDDYQSRNPKERIHTADNERASWTILLSAVQRMEEESQDWQRKNYHASGPPNSFHDAQGFLPGSPPGLRESHTLVVAIQSKRKSWDTMPPTISKPYATTAMCHLVEMMAALGIYWKVFDRRSDRYSAEGNGFQVRGERVSDLGLMFSFQSHGLSDFGRRRVVPVDEIKELCFGWVSTIFRLSKDKRRLRGAEDQVGLSMLQMGSRQEIAQTLTTLGCNKKAVSYFEDTSRRTAHLFSLSFEIVAMLSQTFHIEDTLFTYLPNPTPDVWDKTAVDLRLMMQAFVGEYRESQPQNHRVFKRITAHADKILEYQDDQDPTSGPKAMTLCLYRALHDALADADEILTARVKKPSLQKVNESNMSPVAGSPNSNNKEKTEEMSSGCKIKLLDRIKPDLHQQNKPKSPPDAPIKKTTTTEKTTETANVPRETSKQKDRRALVQHVLRSHIQRVLQLLDGVEDHSSFDHGGLQIPDRRRESVAPRLFRRTSRSPYRDIGSRSGGEDVIMLFDKMDDADPEERQRELMGLYFREVRPSVVPQAATRRSSIVNLFGGGGAGGAGQEDVSPTATPFVRRNLRSSAHSMPPAVIGRNKDDGALVWSKEDASLTRTSSVTLDIRSSWVANGAGIPVLMNRKATEDGGTSCEIDNAGIEKEKGEEEEKEEEEEEEDGVALTLADEVVNHEDVWCTLVFRMICWLTLHDFNKLDRQVAKGELLGSRMPVYIS